MMAKSDKLNALAKPVKLALANLLALDEPFAPKISLYLRDIETNSKPIKAAAAPVETVMKLK